MRAHRLDFRGRRARLFGWILVALVALAALVVLGAPAGSVADWPFETRLAIAEKAGLIRGGCARLPAVARAYRNHGAGAKAEVSERDARTTSQVLHVVMRDLNPSR